MKPLDLAILLAVAACAATATAGCVHAPSTHPPVPSLHGCWRQQVERRHFQDGRAEEVPGSCTRQFTAEEMRVRCPQPRQLTVADLLTILPPAPGGGQVKYSREEIRALLARTPRATVYRYRIDGPGHWVATVTESTASKQPWPAREERYRLEGDRLEIAVDGDPTGDAPPGLQRVETTLVRVAGAEAGACLPRRE